MTASSGAVGRLGGAATAGAPTGPWRRAWRLFLGYPPGLIGAGLLLGLLALVLVAPAVGSFDPYTQDLANSLADPSREHPFGTDLYGRDVLARVLHAGRVSLAIAAGAVAVGAVLGTTIGLLAGYYRGWVDEILMRSIDVFLAFPQILFAILVVALFGTSILNVVVAIGVVSVPAFARLVRGSVLVVKEQEYVTAVRALGAPTPRILWRHILPNVTSPIVVQASFALASSILSAGGLSFLGLGVQPPTPEWGAMLADGRGFLRQAPHLVAFPGLALAAAVLAVNLVGDGLRLALDPRLQSG